MANAAEIHDNALRWVFRTFAGSEPDLRRRLVARLGLPPGARVLVTGAGAGNDLPYLVAALAGEGEIHAQDLAKEMLLAGEARHREALGGTGIRLTFSVSDAMNRLGGARPSITIDQVPLEWCFQSGVKLDFRHFPDGFVASAADVAAELGRIGWELQPLDIVVVNTRAGSRYGHDDYVGAGCGMGYEATMYLLERGVRLTGTDAWSWDVAVLVHREEGGRDRQQGADLGRPQGRARHRLLPPGEAAQPGRAAAARLHHQLLPAQDPRRFRRLDARGRHPGGRKTA